jgi:hypothetical protein
MPKEQGGLGIMDLIINPEQDFFYKQMVVQTNQGAEDGLWQ